MGQEETGDDKEQRAHRVAEAELGHLGDVLAEENDDLSQEKEERECLDEVCHMAGDWSPGAEREVTVVSSRELEGVDAEEHTPEEIATVTSEEAKDGEQGNSGSVSEGSDSEGDSEGAEDIGSDLSQISFEEDNQQMWA